MRTATKKLEFSATAEQPSTTSMAITNQLDVAVDIYDQFDPSTDGQQQPIQYTKLATVPAGGSASVQTIRTVALLVAAVTGKVAGLSDDKYYYQFPIKVMSGTQVTFGQPKPLAYTITSADRSAAVASFQFHKFAMANPDSALTKNFNAALKKGFDKVNEFFKGTKNFTQCTMATWNAVMAWLDNVTSGWQGPYYLYALPPSPAPANYVPQLIATLNIQSDANNNSAVVTMCSADASGNPVYVTPAQQTSLAAQGDGTLQSADSTGTAISLTPVWMNVIQTSVQNNQPVTSYLIGTSVSGTVGGTPVVSSAKARQLPGQPSKGSDFEAQFDKWFGRAAGLIGMLAGLVAIYEFAKKAFGKGEAAKEANKSDATSEADLEAKNATVDSKIQSDIDDPKSGMAAKEASAPDAKDVADGYADISKQMQKDVMTDAVDSKFGALEAQVQTEIDNGVTPDPDFEQAFQDAEAARANVLEKIGEGDFEADWMADFQRRLDKLSETSSSASDEVIERVEDMQKNFEEGSKESGALDTAMEEYETKSQDPNSDSGYDEDDTNTDPEGDPMPPIEGEA